MFGASGVVYLQGAVALDEGGMRDGGSSRAVTAVPVHVVIGAF
jgi:hypothetical protein